MRFKNSTERYLGVTTEGKSLLWWLWALIGVSLLYPLYVVPACHYISSGHYLLAISTIFLAWMFYKLAGVVASYIYNTKNLFDFYSEFCREGTNYRLKKIKLDPSLYDEEDMLHFKMKEAIADRLGMGGKDREVIREPLKVYYAEDIKGYPVVAPKAYVSPTGMAILISRIPSTFNIQLFEKYLLYHELEHINIRGIRNTNTLALSQFLVVVHGVIGMVISEILFDYIFVFIYLCFVGYQRLTIMPAGREAVADHYAIRRFDKAEDINRVYKLLVNAFINEVAYARTRKKAIEYKLRLAKLHDLKIATSLASAFKSIDLPFSAMRVDSFVNDEKVIFGSFILMSMFVISEKDPGNYVQIFVYSFLIFIVLIVIFMVISRSLYHRIYDALSGLNDLDDEIKST